MLGSGVISWSSRKQPIVTLLSTEAEYIVATSCTCQAVSLRNILEELHFMQDRPTPIDCDNTSAINLSNNPDEHGQSKHIEVKYHFFLDLTKDPKISLIYYRSKDEFAYMFTKTLKPVSFLTYTINLVFTNLTERCFSLREGTLAT